MAEAGELVPASTGGVAGVRACAKRVPAGGLRSKYTCSPVKMASATSVTAAMDTTGNSTTTATTPATIDATKRQDLSSLFFMKKQLESSEELTDLRLC